MRGQKLLLSELGREMDNQYERVYAGYPHTHQDAGSDEDTDTHPDAHSYPHPDTAAHEHPPSYQYSAPHEHPPSYQYVAAYQYDTPYGHGDGDADQRPHCRRCMREELCDRCGLSAGIRLYDGVCDHQGMPQQGV